MWARIVKKAKRISGLEPPILFGDPEQYGDLVADDYVEHLRAVVGGWAIEGNIRAFECALREMPPTMRRLWWMALFQWYGMMCYWIYIVPTLAATVFGTDDPHSAGFRDAALLNGQVGGFYNAVAFIAAFALQRLSHVTGDARYGQAAERALAHFYARMAHQPTGYSSLLATLEEARATGWPST